MNDKWECYLCAEEAYFEILPTGYLANYHPLCKNCADHVLEDEDHKEHFRLTYHQEIGDIEDITQIKVITRHFIIY